MNFQRMKSVGLLKNLYISGHTRRRSLEFYVITIEFITIYECVALTISNHVQMKLEENRNDVPVVNPTSIIDCKEIKRIRVTRSWHKKFSYYRIRKCHVIWREKQEHLVTTRWSKENAAGKNSEEKCWMN